MKTNATILTGEDFTGRLSGTSGALKAAEFLERKLKSFGFQPLPSENRHLVPIDVFASRLTGPARLQVKDYTFKHREDFSEYAQVSSGGSTHGKLLVLRDGDRIDEDVLKGKVVLIQKTPVNFDLKGTIQVAIDFEVKALLIESGNPKWFVKTISGSKDSKLLVLKISRDTTEKLIEMAGEMVNIDLPLQSEVLPCHNVVGFLPGKSSVGTFVLAAHYDHLGDDPGGHRFPGAIDNVSGVVTLLEIAKRIVEREEAYPFQIVVVFFSGEESGLKGAKQFIESFQGPLLGAINLDCIGQEWPVKKVRIGYAEPTHWLPSIAKNVFKRHGVEVKRKDYGGEDSVAFRKAGIPALGLGQKPIRSTIRIHTPDDRVDAIQFEALSDWAEMTEEMIEEISKKYEGDVCND